jgi:Zn-dependent membrane protease YugP
MRAATRYIVIFAFITFVVFLWFFWESPESAIRAVLREGAAAVETKDMAGAMSQLSRHYLDENGLNFLAVRRVLGVVFDRFQRIDVRLGDVTVNITGAKAVAQAALQVLVQVQRDNAYAIGAPGAPDLVTITFIKEPLAWKVISVNGIDVSRFGL